MNRKSVKLMAAAGITVAIAASVFSYLVLFQDSGSPVGIGQDDTKFGLVINTPTQTTTIEQLRGVYDKATEADIHRTNFYLFWNAVEPQKGKYSWKQSDVLMKFNNDNEIDTTLYFSVINNRVFGPFPEWMDNPSLDDDLAKKTVDVLNKVLDRYSSIDHVIIGGGLDSYFRYNEDKIPRYKEFFDTVYSGVKNKHPQVSIGNSFSLHDVLSNNQTNTVKQLSTGDFVAFTYMPVNKLHEIDKTPKQAIDDLEKIPNLVGDKDFALLELSWSTSESIGGGDKEQVEFLKLAKEFYQSNKDRISFFVWYRQYDRPEGTCQQDLNTSYEGITFGNEFVLQRAADYICNAGLIDVKNNPKPGWEQFVEISKN